MMPGMNPRKMQQMMKRMGIQQVEIPATEVIIKTADKELIVINPSVSRVNMMGQDTLQISGDIHERELSTVPEISQDDVDTVKEQANVTEQEARDAIEEHDGDLASAIMALTKDE